MHPGRKILLVLGVTFIVIQFIQLPHNTSEVVLSTDIGKLFNVPAPVERILTTACYDCHSNATNYPWYSSIQPVAWMLSNHIHEGKKMLNFSEFGCYSKRRQISKLKAVASQVKEGNMPIAAYKIMHTDARINEVEKKILVVWALRLSYSLSAEH